MNIEDLLLVNQVDLNDLYEQWKKSICERQPCQHKKNQEKASSNKDDRTPSSSCDDCSSEPDLDLILHRQPLNEIELNEETCSRSSLPIEDQIISNDELIITDKLNDSLPIETLAENEQLSPDKNSRISLFKLDKTTSTHSLSPVSRKQSNLFDDFFTDLFIIDKNTTRNDRLGKHEHWIDDAMASYLHPFHDHPHQPCLNN